VIDAHPLRLSAGATSPHPQVLVLRVLAPLVEPVLELLRPARAAWRQALWQMDAVAPRVWAT
jgi:urease accessory protein